MAQPHSPIVAAVHRAVRAHRAAQTAIAEVRHHSSTRVASQQVTAYVRPSILGAAVHRADRAVAATREAAAAVAVVAAEAVIAEATR